MTALLGDVNGKLVLEPSAGRGAFISALCGIPRKLDAIDVSETSVTYLERNFPAWVKARQADFIDLFVSNPLERFTILEREYDAIIANPPFGLKMSKEYRSLIKSIHPDVYARESYGLFLHFSLQLLKGDGRYVFIIPDTFLHSAYHKSLRKLILKHGAPTHIIQFRSSRFETVNFGYGSLCIIAGNGRSVLSDDKIIWVDAQASTEPLSMKSFADDGQEVRGEELIATVESGWSHPARKAALKHDSFETTLGEIAECRTGIYSGDNLRWCGFSSELGKVRGVGHPIEWGGNVRETQLSVDEQKTGILSGPHYVPLIKGGHRQPLETTAWAINWSKKAVEFYASNKKARLQNSNFYFKRGLAIPMVTSGRISASLMQDSIFDQGVVGVFPHDEALIAPLLIYLNSDRVSTAVKMALNSSANNSANYIKRFPIPKFSNSKKIEADMIVARAKNKGWESTYDDRVNFIDSLFDHQSR
ncbi:class I SAM-dependent methyltransferase [Sphingopyxis sp. PET50]|uniref:class I SAM-dependent methyltransferase n=1 Tax=Sphingopyxis sp. PET50 TaxID=2976533 RepID=UPI0021AE7B47|nr:class I SAM-dependent methyltransferase [Sphingopyxis sp. PET50]